MSDEVTRDVEASQVLLQDKLNEISVSVLERGPVSAASQKSDAAGARVRQLKESQQQLRARAIELGDEIGRLSALCRDSLIEQFAGAKGLPDISKQLASLPGMEIEHKLVAQAATQIAASAAQGGDCGSSGRSRPFHGARRRITRSGGGTLATDQ
jgi:hypothetical protein